MRKTNKKSLLTISICLIVMTIFSLLCACLPDKSKESDISIWFYDQPSNYSLGRFKITTSYYDEHANYLGIKPRDKNDFIKFIKSSDLYGGELIIKDCERNDWLDRHNEKIGSSVYIFASDGYIWLGRFYTNKLFKIMEVPAKCIFILNGDKSILINGLLLSPTDNEEYHQGVEYRTPWNWDELKILFNNSAFDDNNHTIEITYKFYYSPSITVQIIYNEENSTICIKELQM